MNEATALVELLRLLKARNYQFTAVTPATHARVLARPCERPGLRDIFGWNRTFVAADLDDALLDCAKRAGMVQEISDELRSTARVASLADDLFLHSGFPTVEPDATFFGPDTYRFARFIREQIPLLQPQPRWVVDMGTGSGAGAVAAARLLPNAHVTAIDINPAALDIAAVNAEAAGVRIETSLASAIPNGCDLILANPPYIMDSARRTYRDGGDLFGGQVALEWARQALACLVAGGTMLLYTGASVVDGSPPLAESLAQLCGDADAELCIEESDPDVFGDELDQPAYACVERIAVLRVVVRKP